MLQRNRHLCLAILALTMTVLPSPASSIAAEPSGISLELNKFEPSESGCRVFTVIDNRSEAPYSAFKLDLVLFQPDGIIGKRITLDLAPVKARKRTVKAFDIDKMKCDGIGSILVNEVTDCRAEAEPVENCLGRLTLKSLSAVQLTK